MVAKAFAIRNQLLSGPDDSIEAMIERLGIARGRLTSLVRLSYLAPDIMRAILEGRQPIRADADAAPAKQQRAAT
jgi:site-specific DNA recombinase